MKHNLFKNWSIIVTGAEIIMLGAFFIANNFRFARPDIFSSLASHIDDPPFATIDIVVGTVIVVAAIYDIRPLLRWSYPVAAFIWMAYGLAFMLQNIEMMGHPFGRLDCWLMFAIAARVIIESWAGDEK